MVETQILLVEDDPNLGYVLQENLESQGFGIERCLDGETALEVYLGGNFDLCLIDVMLPKKDGFAVAKEIRRSSRDTPIIFLTAKSMKEDRIEGFRIGADDYIVKPFSMEELVLRIQAVLRRTARTRSVDQPVFSLGNYQFDYANQCLKIGEDSKNLTSKEADLLRLLCLRKNEVLERDVALQIIWGDNNYFNARSMDVYVSKLRKYLNLDSRIEIRNVHGKGFKLVEKN